MPGICDPGYRLISAAIDEGLPVEVLPGRRRSTPPWSLRASQRIRSSSWATCRAGKASWKKRCAAISSERRTCIAYESPHRLAKTLAAASPILGDRRIAICRELTKKFEEITRGTPVPLAALPEKVKGEIVLVFAGTESSGKGQKELVEDATLKETLEGMLTEGLPARRIAELIAPLTGLSRNQVYKMVLAIKGEM